MSFYPILNVADHLKSFHQSLNSFDTTTTTTIMDPNENLFQLIDKLSQRVELLEQENIDLTNELYRLENSLDARIDILMEKLLWKTV
jgi:hypothetical protein